MASDLHGEDEQLDRLRRLERAVFLHCDLESSSAAQDMSGMPNDRNETDKTNAHDPNGYCAKRIHRKSTRQGHEIHRVSHAALCPEGTLS